MPLEGTGQGEVTRGVMKVTRAEKERTGFGQRAKCEWEEQMWNHQGKRIKHKLKIEKPQLVSK